jgi:mannosyl-3-phosphoglycerate phosphatase
MSLMAPFIIFSDLDGTLLDPVTGSADAALDVIGMLAQARVPLVFCSSKTRAEIQLLQHELGVHHPFIAENGGALYIPKGYFAFDIPWGRPSPSSFIVIQYGRPYTEVVEKLGRAAQRARVPVLGFNDMSVNEVARECALTPLSARLAKLREHSEPFRVTDTNAASRRRLERAILAEGLTCCAGIPFHFARLHKDQGLPVRMLISLYRRATGQAHTVGFGDAFDDLPMLQRVDTPVIVRRETDVQLMDLLAKLPRAVLTSTTGPAGWADEVTRIVTESIASGSSARSLQQ